MRDELNNDPDNAMRIEQEWFTTVQSGIEYEAKKKPKKNRQARAMLEGGSRRARRVVAQLNSSSQVLPATQMLPIIQSGAQLRINGNHKFKEGKYREALMMYLQVR